MGRYASGHGHGMGGRSVSSRSGVQAGLPTDMLSPLGKGLVAKNEAGKMYKKPVEPPTPAKAPEPDKRSRDKYAHVGMNGAPTIYTEKSGGRAGMRGKRGA